MKKNQKENDTKIVTLTGEEAQKFMVENFGVNIPVNSTIDTCVMPPENECKELSECDCNSMKNAIVFDSIVVNPNSKSCILDIENAEKFNTVYPCLMNNVLIGYQYSKDIYNQYADMKDPSNSLSKMYNNYRVELDNSFITFICDRYAFFANSFYISIYSHMNTLLIYLYGPSYNMNDSKWTISDNVSNKANRKILDLLYSINSLSIGKEREEYMNIVYSCFTDIILPNTISDIFKSISHDLMNTIYRKYNLDSLNRNDKVMLKESEIQNKMYQDAISNLTDSICRSYPAALTEIYNIIEIINQNKDYFIKKESTIFEDFEY